MPCAIHRRSKRELYVLGNLKVRNIKTGKSKRKGGRKRGRRTRMTETGADEEKRKDDRK